MKDSWTKRCYARLLIDNHITDNDAAFMARFSPDEYVSMVKRAGVESAMVYACCHNGNCYYPTQVGHRHNNLRGRDIFGETVSRLRDAGISPIAYYTVIFHNHSARHNPQWRMTDAAGQQHTGRYWHSCPNSPDCVSFFKSQISEVIQYDVDGIFVDMTFWPKVCCCASCRERYLQETGLEIPEVINWNDPAWVTFQRARETWMAGFAHTLTDHIRTARPAITVTHQFSPVLAGWSLGQSAGIAAASDYPSGDFYGGKSQQRLGVKILDAFRHNDMPFEFMTSRCVDLWDHTSMKSSDELFCSAITTLAHGGAYFFIDAINPDGTLDNGVYERLGQISAKAKPFADKIRELHPSLCADIGLYFSMASHDETSLNNISLRQLSTSGSNMTNDRFVPVVRELIGTSMVLGRAHIPYRIIVAGNDCEGVSTLIINSARNMSVAETERIRAFVSEGGTLIATGETSLCDLNGNSSGEFALADVFGISFSGNKAQGMSYLHNKHLGYLVSHEAAPLVRATTAKGIAKVVLPYCDPADTEHYASIHSNPPGRPTEFDALTVNKFGRGKCVYLYSSMLGTPRDAHQQFALKLTREHIKRDIIADCNAPACVEVTLLKTPDTCDGNKYLLCLVNWQDELPNVPVHDVNVSLKLPRGFTCKTCMSVSTGRAADFQMSSGVLTVHIPRLESAEFIEIAPLW